jgi:RNA polymerase sigma factor (sigma-70 family)
VKNEKMGEREFEGFYKKKYKSLVKYVYGKVKNYDDAEEIVSEAFCQFIEEWGPKYYTISPQTLLQQICKRQLIDFWRNSARTEKTLDFNNKFIQNIVYDKAIDIEKSYFDEEDALNLIIQEELECLPPLYRDIMKMYYFEGKTQDEIAQNMTSWQPNICNAIEYGNKMLKVRLKKRGIHHE